MLKAKARASAVVVNTIELQEKLQGVPLDEQARDKFVKLVMGLQTERKDLYLELDIMKEEIAELFAVRTHLQEELDY